MKKSRIFAAGLMVLLAFTTAGCGKESEEEIFSEDLVPLDEEELEALEEGNQGDDQFEVMDEDMLVDDPEVELEESSEETNKEASKEAKLERTGIYTDKDDVIRYIHEYGHLPSNYITKKEARDLGWSDGADNLSDVAPGKNIGGDEYNNADKMLPEEEGRVFYECDVNVEPGERGEEKVIYTNDGQIFYTGDNMETFEQVY